MRSPVRCCGVRYNAPGERVWRGNAKNHDFLRNAENGLWEISSQEVCENRPIGGQGMLGLFIKSSILLLMSAERLNFIVMR